MPDHSKGSGGSREKRKNANGSSAGLAGEKSRLANLKPIEALGDGKIQDTARVSVVKPDAAGIAVRDRPPLLVANDRTEISSLRRIVRSADILNPESGISKEALWATRAQASARFHLALREAKTQLKLISELVPDRPLPARLFGVVLQPSGKPAAHIQVDASLPARLRERRRTAYTDKDGAFSLSLPGGTVFPANGLALNFRGANRAVDITLRATQIAPNGLAGNILLPQVLEPLPVSIIASLKALLPAETDVGPTPAESAAPATTPALHLGEEGQCQLAYNCNVSVDRFPFSIFVRLVEPRTSIVTPTILLPLPNSGRVFPVTDYFPLSEDNGVVVSYVDRVPVDQPISIDGFRDQLIGVGDGTTVSSFESVAMAGTLGLGYILRMSQSWTWKGLTLGNLVYSLPMAPGEQQRVAIFERRETSQVFETESLNVSERQRFDQLSEASTESVFSSAFSESARGGSHFQTESDSWAAGGSIIIFSAGGGGSSSSGNSSTWLEGHRDYAARAVEDVHTSLHREASASRRLARTGMRLASATESADVTTKVITNHNHTRALTLQYWEVQRLYEISTNVDGVELVCLVPLEVVRFLPAGQPRVLTGTAGVDSRGEILLRYSSILKHADVLERRLPRRFQHGLTMLRQFAADPRATFQPAAAVAQDVIHFEITGTFLPFEQIFVSAVTRRGTRLGPVRLTGKVDPIAEDLSNSAESFSTQDALMGELRARRNNDGSGFTLTGDMTVPLSLARNDIVGFEITRRFIAFDYELVHPMIHAIAAMTNIGIDMPETGPPDHLFTGSVHLTPQQLERELGGPFVWDFKAKIHTSDGDSEESYVQDYLDTSTSHQLPPAALPIPALQLAPVLRYAQLLEIEQMVQHVVNNTVAYSKAVWQSLSAEERAIMLEGFTIGVPPDGIEDESQNIPLLNCVENRVLGFFGNSMIMPFMIPRSVADEMEFTSGQIQDTLTEFHKTGFSPPKSLVALPTRGVLGEAVLGSCPSAEKIDLTRFWNWADAPADTAPEISPVTVPTTQPSLLAGVQGPSALTGITPLINNINASPTVPGSEGTVLQSLIKAASEQAGFSPDLTGASILGTLLKNTQDIAGQGRADAFKITRDLNAQAMATVGNIVGGIYGKNPQAGSQAAASVYGNAGATKDFGGSDSGSAGSKEDSSEGGGDDKGKEDEDEKKDEGGGDE
jgi:hypothetical protein